MSFACSSPAGGMLFGVSGLLLLLLFNTSKLNFELDESDKLANMFFMNLTSSGTFTEGIMINVPLRILIDGHDTFVTLLVKIRKSMI